ncbi:MAG: hypothetical protein AB7I25_05240 [Vicinamibacterales bacterium]
MRRPRARAACAVVALLAAAAGLPRAEVAAQTAAPAVTLWNLNAYDILFVLSGGGANAVALTRDDGVVLIDPLPGLGKASLEALSTVTDQPVRTIVNLRSSVEALKANLDYPDVTTVIAPKAVADRAAQLGVFAGAAAKFAPSTVVTGTATLLDGPDVMDLMVLGPGRTGAEALIVFKEKRLAYMSELFPRKAVPVVEPALGGSLIGLTQTLAKARAAVTTARSAVPGRESPKTGGVGLHKPQSVMPISTTAQWKDVEEYADFVAALVEAGRRAKAAGRTPEQAAAELQLPERFAAYDVSGAAAAFAVLYAELPPG